MSLKGLRLQDLRLVSASAAGDLVAVEAALNEAALEASWVYHHIEHDVYPVSSISMIISYHIYTYIHNIYLYYTISYIILYYIVLYCVMYAS